jgi:hypothetical protein
MGRGANVKRPLPYKNIGLVASLTLRFPALQIVFLFTSD